MGKYNGLDMAYYGGDPSINASAFSNSVRRGKALQIFLMNTLTPSDESIPSAVALAKLSVLTVLLSYNRTTVGNNINSFLSFKDTILLTIKLG
jgi:hypothetical protein